MYNTINQINQQQVPSNKHLKLINNQTKFFYPYDKVIYFYFKNVHLVTFLMGTDLKTGKKIKAKKVPCELILSRTV